MLKNVRLLLLIVVLFNSCCKSETDINGLGYFDISKNDEFLLFSYFKNGISRIYLSNIDGTETRVLFEATGDTSFYNPKFSPNSDKIIFLANKKGSLFSCVYISDINGKNRQCVLGKEGNQIITEATFSNTEKLIYFSTATSYKNYSPLGVPDFHDYFIYSYELKTLKVLELTEEKAYGIGCISEVDSSYLLMRLENGVESGIYSFHLKEHNFNLVVPKNNPRNDPSLYYLPALSEKYKFIVFTAPYELYLMDMETKDAKLIHGPKDGSGLITGIRFFHNEKRILFSKYGRNGKLILMSVNFDGTNLNEINILDINE